MIGLRIWLVAAFCTVLVIAGDLKGELTSAGISAVFPGDSGYVNASTACASFLLNSTSCNLTCLRSQLTIFVPTCRRHIS